MICYLIDDDEDDREFFAMALAEVDPSVSLTAADNAEDALSALRKQEIVPDIIFLDINMPRIDGWECLRLIREMAHIKDLPVVIYSTSEHILNAGEHAAFNGFLTKQAKISELVRKLREIFPKITA